jgi:hypothetical protein
MPKRRPARKVSNLLVFLFFVFFLVSFVDAALSPASAQDISPTPEEATPAGTPSVIPELPTVGPVSISYPIHGQTLQGIVNITGSIALEGWTSYELAFSYADIIPVGDNTDPNWFPFATGTNPIVDGLLTAWDTTALTDRDYNLRLRVFGPGDPQDVFVYGLRVRNYIVDTPLPTLTPTPSITPLASPTPTVTATFTPLPTVTPFSVPTPLPPNPATLRPDEIVFNLARGVLFTAMLFGIFGLFLHLRAKRM